MAAGTFTLYDHVAESIGDGSLDLDNDTFNIVLVSSASNFATATLQPYSGLTNELATANGYTAGGAALTSVTWNRSAGIATFDSADQVWTASGGSITARAAVIYDNTHASDWMIGYMLLDATPADVTATDGNTLTVGPNATNGWFRQTVNPA